MAKRNNSFRIEMLLLCILKEKDYYGYELAKAVKEKSLGAIDLKEGTMYPILYKLLDSGYIKSYEEMVNRKVRVYYHIESSGISYLYALIEEYRIMLAGIENILKLGGEQF